MARKSAEASDVTYDADERRPLLVCFAYYFPPSNEVASLRAAYLVKAAIAAGWFCEVVTAEATDDQHDTEFDDILNNELVNITHFGNSGTNIYGKIFGGLFDFLRDQIKPLARQIIRRLPLTRFEPAAIWHRKALQLVEDGVFDRAEAIWSTSGPVHSHMLASSLTRRSERQMIWIADYRDPWSGSHFFKLIFGYNRQRQLEKRTLADANHITCVSVGHAQYLQNLHNRKITVFYNGYEDEPDDSLLRESGLNEDVWLDWNNADKLIGVYTGTLYNHFDKRQIIWFLKTILGISDKIELIFLGNDQLKLAKNFRQNDRVHFLGNRSRETSKLFQARANFLLFFHEPEKPNEMIPASSIISAKAFEYLRSRKPIIAIGNVVGSRSEAFRFFKKSNPLFYYNFTDRLDICSLQSFLLDEDVRSRKSLHLPIELSRKTIMDQYVELFKRA